MAIIGNDTLAVFGGGLFAGILNAVAGGGTLISYPILLWLGRDPIVANATNALALWPGSLSGAWGFRREIRAIPALLRSLVPAAILGGLLGGFLLIATPVKLFSGLVPYLILFATALLAIKSLLGRWTAPPPSPAKSGNIGIGLFLGQFAISIYGGYFGAGMGILMLATFGLFGLQDFHERNAVKNLLSATTNGCAGIFFIVRGAIHWRDTMVLGAGAIVGGLIGAGVGRRVSSRTLEYVAILVGIIATLTLALGRG